MRQDGLLDWHEVASGTTTGQRKALHRLGVSKRRISLLDYDGAQQVIRILIDTDERNKSIGESWH